MFIATLLLMGTISTGNALAAPCLSSGCFYDLQEDISKLYECQPDGRLQILSFAGNDGCDVNNFIDDWESSVDNACCTTDVDIIRPCVNNLDCVLHDATEYCRNGKCEKNLCYDAKHPNLNDCVIRVFEENICDIFGGCECSTLNGGEDGICVPEDQNTVSSTAYTVNVNNKSGKDQIIGIFETNPDPTVTGTEFGGNSPQYPLIFQSQGIENLGRGHFSWVIGWGLSWSSGQVLGPGSQYSRIGRNIVASPGSSNNGAKITFNSAADTWDISGAQLSAVAGVIEVQTDSSFTNGQAVANDFTICVTNEGIPVFAIDGEPNSVYTFKLEPTYYLTTIDSKVGDTVSADVTSQSQELKFAVGLNTVTCDLDPNNGFSNCIYSA